MPFVSTFDDFLGNRYENTRCSVVIINELHVLSTATCVKRFSQRSGDTKAVAMLGVWDETDSPEEELSCNDKDFCVPGPELYKVVEIKVHPQTDKDTGTTTWPSFGWKNQSSGPTGFSRSAWRAIRNRKR